jgi:hypothetical protein
VDAGQQSGANPDSIPLICLDTLCCPAKDGPGKQMAIKKIRLVYQNAMHVLVLDAGLMSYRAMPLEVTEKIVRIFTSSWVRRLWTLQEGALAKSLHFQFADQSLSLRTLHEQLLKMGLEMRHRSFYFDIANEFLRLASFFHFKNLNVSRADLSVLGEALQYRGVSVASDEPLCIGTLMSLDLDLIVRVQPEDRMKKAWELIAESRGGIPAQMIFFEEQRINALGWRWAPSSFLTIERGIFGGETRSVRWRDAQLGQLKPLGLRVTFPGYRISIRQYPDEMPQNPWSEMRQIPESYLNFREAETGQWYRISDKKYAFLERSWTADEQREEYNELKRFPLHDLACTGEAVVILGGWRTSTSTESQGVADGILEDIDLLGGRKEILVSTKIHLVVTPLLPENGYIYDSVEKLALRLRDSPITYNHLKILNSLCQDSEEFWDSGEALRQEMKDMVGELVRKDPRFVAAVNKFFGGGFCDHMWTLVRDWFRDDVIGTSIPKDQVWIID